MKTDSVSPITSWESMQDEFSLDPAVTYLNAAAVGPLPNCSRDALGEFYRLTAETPWKVDEVVDSAGESCRQLGATLIGADPADVTYAYSTSYGLSLAVNGLPLDAGDEVILFEKDFPANPYVWRTLAVRGVKLRFAESDAGLFSLKNVERLINTKTKVIAVSFVQFYNGYKLPVKELADLAHAFDGYLVIDAIQGLGVEPVDFREWKIDVLSAGAQKWLLGPGGIGLVVVSSRTRDAMRPVAQSWRSVAWDNYVDMLSYDKPLLKDARRFSMGTSPGGHLVALSHSLRLLTDLGTKNIQTYLHGLLDPLIDFIHGASAYRVLSSLEPDRRSSILLFTSDDYEKVFARFESASVICSKREGGIRISPHVYNKPADISRVLELL